MVTLTGAVVDGTRAGESNRTSRHGLTGQVAHRPDVLWCCGFTIQCTLSHHIHAQRCVWDLNANVHIKLTLIDVVHIFRKTLPGPLEAFIQYNARNVLDSFHQLNDLLPVTWAHWRKSYAAVSGDDCCDAMVAGRCHAACPGCLAVVMGMDIDKPRCHQCAVSIDGSSSPGIDATNF